MITREAVLEKEGLDADEVKKLYDLLKYAVRAQNERLFVVMTAHAKGWQFAKKLDFYQSGD